MGPRFIKILVVAAVAVGLYFWASHLKRDLNLVNKPVSKGETMKWELGEVETTRLIGRDQWDIAAKNVVRDHPVDHLKDVSALISGPSGERTVRSPSGKYDSKKKELTLEDAKGYWKRPQYPLTYETPLAHWTQNGDHWDFPHGVTVSGDVYSLECESAEMSGQRNIRVKNGCLVWWSQ